MNSTVNSYPILILFRFVSLISDPIRYPIDWWRCTGSTQSLIIVKSLTKRWSFGFGSWYKNSIILCFPLILTISLCFVLDAELTPRNRDAFFVAAAQSSFLQQHGVSSCLLIYCWTCEVAVKTSAPGTNHLFSEAEPDAEPTCLGASLRALRSHGVSRMSRKYVKRFASSSGAELTEK